MFKTGSSQHSKRRRDQSRGGGTIAAVLRSKWRIALFLLIIAGTSWNLNRLMSSNHAEHVSKGVQRLLPEGVATADKAAEAGTTVSDDAAQRNSAGQKLRGKRQVKLLNKTGGSSDERKCRIQQHAEYTGSVVKWGTEHMKDSADACCDACKSEAQCNVFVWCGADGGCGGNKRGECWLKRQERIQFLDPDGNIGSTVPWTSGTACSDAEWAAADAARAAAEAGERVRLGSLANNETLPLVFLDVEIDGEDIGRMLFVLFVDESPIAAENYRQLFTGERGVVPKAKDGARREGEGLPYHLRGAYFYRIIHRFIDQTGADVESVYGGRFDDDPGAHIFLRPCGLALKHDRKGLLSVANMGPNTTTSHFSILQAPAPHLNGAYTIFGELVDGWDVAAKINALSIGKPDNTAGRESKARITDAGQVRLGAPIKLPAKYQAKLDAATLAKR